MITARQSLYQVHFIRETTTLTAGDCFRFWETIPRSLDTPIHYHEEYELKLLLNAGGAKRFAGGSIELIDDLELTLIGPGLYHTWLTAWPAGGQITEITIQFHHDLFSEKFLQWNQLNMIRDMLASALRGVTFSRDTVLRFKSRIQKFGQLRGFASVVELLSISNELSVSGGIRTLSDNGFATYEHNHKSRRMERVYQYLHVNYQRQITLTDVAVIAGMPDSSFSRFIKKLTGNTFIDNLNEIRIGNAARMLIDSTNSVAEIAYSCGFNSLSYFNRIFKKKKSCVPKEFREIYTSNIDYKLLAT